MGRIGIGIGAVLAVAGAIWLAQGLNLPFAPASFMTGDRAWVFLGAVTLAAGGGLAWWSWRSTAAGPRD
jgi:hypothetical protein